MELNVDLSADGLAMLFRDYQVEALNFVWGSGKGVTSREVYEAVNTKISRASIINFLKAMAKQGILLYTEEPGKGGYHRVYRTGMKERELWAKVAETANQKLGKMLG